MAAAENKRARVYEHIRRHLVALDNPEDTVLELGCGGKQYEACFSGRHFGMDITVGNYPGVGPDVLGDAQVLPFRDNSVDLIFVVAALCLMPSIDSVLRDCHRILRPGGKMVVFDYNYWVTGRIGGPNRFTSFRLFKLLKSAGFYTRIHWDCVPCRGPSCLHFLYRCIWFRWMVYLVSNWVVVSGCKAT